MAQTEIAKFGDAKQVATWLINGLRGYLLNKEGYWAFAPIDEKPSKLWVQPADRDSYTVSEDIEKMVFQKLDSEKQVLFRTGAVVALDQLEVVASNLPLFEELFLLVAYIKAHGFVVASTKHLLSGLFELDRPGGSLFDLAYDVLYELSASKEDPVYLLAYARSKYFKHDVYSGLLLEKLAKIDPEHFSNHMDEFERGMTAQVISWGDDAAKIKVQFAESFVSLLGRDSLLELTSSKAPSWGWLQVAITSMT